MHNVNVNKYLPPVIRSAREFQKIADGENPEFNLTWQNIDVVWANQYVMQCTVEGVQRWEKIIGINARINDNLTDRKIRILSYINRTLPFTIRVLENYIESICGNGNFSIVLDCVGYTLNIKTIGLSTIAMEDVSETLDLMIPADLVYTHVNVAA